jgi:hypothetical protein
LSKPSFSNHPELVANWSLYERIADFEDGSPERVVKYLRPHAAEMDAEGLKQFQIRSDRLYNVNFCSPYLWLHWGHLSQPISVKGAESEQMQEILKDVTGYRESHEQVQRERVYSFLRDGRIGTLVDSPAVVATNLAEARAKRERSYQKLYRARQIRYWQQYSEGPRKGQLAEVILEESPITVGGKSFNQYRRLLQPPEPDAFFQWEILQETSSIDSNRSTLNKPIECDVTDAGLGGIRVLPFVIMGSGPADSFIKDVVPLNLAHMNLESVLSSIIYNQGFQRVIFTGVSKEEVSKVTEWTITLLKNEAAKVAEIPPGNPDAVFKEIERLERQIHRRAKFEFNQLSDDTRQVQSAGSKAKDLIVQHVIYNNTLDYSERVETEIFRMHAMYEDKTREPTDVQVSIARDFGLEDPEAESMELAAAFAEAGQLNVPELQKAILAMRASKLRYIPQDDKTEEQVREEILAAIANASPSQSTALSDFRAAGGGLFVSADSKDPQDDEQQQKQEP